MTTTATALAPMQYATRLENVANVDPATWQILCEVVFPLVQNPRSIVLAVGYCRARKLDILKRPVNIVPMWNSALQKEVDTIWPSINEALTTAHRTHEFAGIDAPVYGPMIERKFTGRRKDKNGGWSDASVTLTYPEWCQTTVHRIVQKQVRAFTCDPIYWLEAYGRSGGTELPNGTWQKRPIGMLSKVSKAAALRNAFPEEIPLTDDEMAGHIIDDNFIAAPNKQRPVITQVPDPTPSAEWPKPMPRGDENWQVWGERYIAIIRGFSDVANVDKMNKDNQEFLDTMGKEMPRMHSTLMHAINKHKLTLLPDDNA